MLSKVITAEAVAAGQLRLLLPDSAGVSRDVWVVYAPNRNLSARVRAFVDFLFETVPTYFKAHRL